MGIACRYSHQGANQKRMKQLCLHKNVFARIADRLKPYEHQIIPVCLDSDGGFSNGWTLGSITDPAPDIAYGAPDTLFNSNDVNRFVSAVLASEQFDWFQSGLAGFDRPEVQKILEKVPRFSTTHVQSEPMAEWVLWQAMDWMRKGPEHRANQRAEKWERLFSKQIAGSKWVIYGFGHIGKAVSKRLQALGAYVTGVRRSGGDDALTDQMVTPENAAAPLAEADVVLLALPLSPATNSFANDAFFKGMKADSLFINIGRGGLVDEADLVTALDAGTIDFAALDVTREEPLPKGHPFWQHEKIALTPHDSAIVANILDQIDQAFVDNLGRYLASEPIIDLVHQ